MKFGKAEVETIIVGAGPYGLSLAAHLRSRRASFRIFGKPMDFWISHMPKGMFLKSEGFASNLYDPGGDLTLERYCAKHGIEYADIGIPVGLDTFIDYGLEFAKNFAPDLDQRMIARVENGGDGFRIETDEGQTLSARRVVVAVGIAPFAHVPPELANLPRPLVSHSAEHTDLSNFRGLRVAVVGGGASALDLAKLLHDHGVDTRLVSRRNFFRFNEKPAIRAFSTSVWDQLREPMSGIGPGWRNKIFGDAPWAVHYLPDHFRREIYRRSHGPAGGWFVREAIESEIDVISGYWIASAQPTDKGVNLVLRASDSANAEPEKHILVDHVIAATGYRLDIDKLDFIGKELRSRLDVFEGAPRLNARLESSVPGLSFVGGLAAPSFGPVLRFAFGAGFTSRRLSRSLAH